MITNCKRYRTSLLVVSLATTFLSRAHGGDLIVYNTGSSPAVCTVDGYTAKTGADKDVQFKVAPGEKLSIPPNLASTSPVLNWLECGSGLRTRAMNISAEGANRVVFINGRQKRTLNVILYSVIPTDPTVGYEPLVRGVTLRYQAQHPEVLLNLVLDPAIDIYDFDSLKDSVLGKDGFDVAELDTVFLRFLVSNDLITPAKIEGDEPWPIAKESVVIDGKTYAVPSWLCSDFLFSADPGLDSFDTFPKLKEFFSKVAADNRPALVGDLDGSWTIPALYIHAYIQMHTGSDMRDALKMPPDQNVIARMAELGSACDFAKSDPCVDATYHNARDGSVELAFDSEHAGADLGFSERSFYLQLFQHHPQRLALIPLPWGNTSHSRRVVYSDAFVTSKATCGNSPCQADSTGFETFMTKADTKKFIAFAEDLPAGSPPRHLLVATQPFYALKAVKADPIYTQVLSALFARDIVAYPNIFTPDLKYQLLSGICPLLKQSSPGWICKVPEPPKH
jgi:thiamine pyridinylase